MNNNSNENSLVVLNNTSIPVVTGCGFLAATVDFMHVDRIADFNVLIYVIEGAIYVTEDETDYTIAPGELFFLKAGHHHYGKQMIRKGTKWHYVHFSQTDCAAFPPSEDYLLTGTLPKKTKIPTNGKIHHMIAAYTHKYENWVVPPDWRSGVELYDILLNALEYVNPVPVQSKDALIVSQIKSYLSENICSAYSASVLEQTFFLDYKYMAKLFKSETGMTMQEYHNGKKIEEANRLLRNTMLSVSEVAEAVGYKDALYFSRVYHQLTGMSPSQYRKQVIQV